VVGRDYHTHTLLGAYPGLQATRKRGACYPMTPLSPLSPSLPPPALSLTHTLSLSPFHSHSLARSLVLSSGGGAEGEGGRERDCECGALKEVPKSNFLSLMPGQISPEKCVSGLVFRLLFYFFIFLFFSFSPQTQIDAQDREACNPSPIAPHLATPNETLAAL
jgi:hypothetical protein